MMPLDPPSLVFAILAKLEAEVQALPHPNDATSVNLRTQAIGDRARLERLRDALAMCFKLAADEHGRLDTATKAQKVAQKAKAVAATALDAAVAAGKVGKESDRAKALMIGDIERQDIEAASRLAQATLIREGHEVRLTALLNEYQRAKAAAEAALAPVPA